MYNFKCFFPRPWVFNAFLCNSFLFEFETNPLQILNFKAYHLDICVGEEILFAVNFEKVERTQSVSCPNVRCKGVFCSTDVEGTGKVECKLCKFKANIGTVLEHGRVESKFTVMINSIPYDLALDIVKDKEDIVSFLLANAFDVQAYNLVIKEIQITKH